VDNSLRSVNESGGNAGTPRYNVAISGGVAISQFVGNLNSQIVLESFVVPVGFNTGTFGPVSLATGAVVTVPSGSVCTIV